jgi:predicted transcriptional regulator
MGKQALHTYVDPEQKRRIERIARRRRISLATIIREAIGEYIARHDMQGVEGAADEAWARLLDGYYDGSGARNAADDIYHVEKVSLGFQRS